MKKPVYHISATDRMATVIDAPAVLEKLARWAKEKNIKDAENAVSDVRSWLAHNPYAGHSHTVNFGTGTVTIVYS